MAAAIAPCFVGACNVDLIIRFFTNYYEESKELMTDQLVAVLTGWLDILEKIKLRIQSIVDALESLADHIATVPEKVKEIEQRVCDKDACLGPVITEFMDKGAWQSRES